MDLLDRYLQSVGKYLPRAQRNDILQELSENIVSQMEDRESQLGRPLTSSEEEAVLKQHGHPMLVASRYRRIPLQHLIGPAMFPFYWYALLTILLIAAAAHIIAAVIGIAGGGDVLVTLDKVWGGFWTTAVFLFGMVTAIFAVLDYFQVKVHFLEHWKPRSLPPVSKRSCHNSPAHLTAEIFSSLGLIFMWLAWPQLSHVILSPFNAIVKFSPVWQTFQTPILWWAFAGAVQAYVFLIRPGLCRYRPAVRVVYNGFGILIISMVLRTGDPVVAAIDSDLARAGIVSIINYSITYGVIFALALDSLMEIIRWVRRPYMPMRLRVSQ